MIEGDVPPLPDRVQLLFTLAIGGRTAMAEAAEQMGYVHRPRSQHMLQVDAAPVANVSPAAPSPASPPRPTAVELAPVRFWRPVAREYRESLDGQVLPSAAPSTTQEVQPEDLDPGDAVVRRHEPLVAWPRLWRALEDRLRTPRPRQAIDVERLVMRWARGEVVRQLPRRTGLAHAPLTVVLDSSDRLMPFWRDQRLVLGRLARKLGRQSVRRVEATALLAGRLPVLGAEERMLALTDLGGFGSAATRRAWDVLGARLSRRSVAPPVALVAAPARLWPSSVQRCWQAVEWENPNRQGGLRALEPPTAATAVEAVLQRASVAQRLETGLARGLRRLVAADLGTEVELWRHPDVIGRDVGGLVLEPIAAKSWRAAFRRLPSAEKAAVAHLLERWHSVLPETLAVEVYDLLTCGTREEVFSQGIVEAALLLLARIFRRVARGGGVGRGFDLETDAWFGRIGQWGSLELWRDPRLRVDLEQAVKAHRRRYPEEMPTGMTPEMLAAEGAAAAEVRRWQVVQRSQGLVVEHASSLGSPIAEITSRRTPALLMDGLKSPVPLRPGAAEAPPCVTTIYLTSDVETVALEAWQPVLDDVTSWASAVGRDTYGLWAAFEVEGVRQRLRWIPPGRFWMGSPEDEKGRWDDEGPRHSVTLTEGFWLAEAPCTQALWKAVMGENPSQFQGDDKPVEKVSWDDSQRFIERLNQRFHDFEARLPTEAEWEYACRAGTTSAIWCDEDSRTEKSERKKLGDIAWYDANSGGETHEVMSKEANPWGLYDLLGNVDEWCWDPWRDAYSGLAEIDPEGPRKGSERVIRGGSWIDHARDVRAADRSGFAPGVRLPVLGFRLSRGRAQVLRGAEQEPRGSGSESARRGTSRRTGDRRSRAWVERLQWANDGGTDAFGRWASFEVDGVVTRLRWMVPGRFQMGSPEEEQGRWDAEGPRHEVTLTQGFWLGETPCTQDLWQAVMGSNPSHFRSARRPVETVSWQDVQEFLGALEQRVPGLAPRLPTEAWWEYACRAGTDKATWLGDLEIVGERDAPILDAIAWYGGNSGVAFDLPEGWDSSDWAQKQYPHVLAGTREVGLKNPNPWGLQDMLGNVFEWVSDDWADGYPKEAQIDPEGPGEGSERVIRGGSWLDLARLVRAACRGRVAPEVRGPGLGFRVSRGRET